MPEQINLNAAGLLGLSVSLRIVEALNSRGVLSNQETGQLYRNALTSIGEGAERDEASRILGLLVTGWKG